MTNAFRRLLAPRPVDPVAAALGVLALALLGAVLLVAGIPRPTVEISLVVLAAFAFAISLARDASSGVVLVTLVAPAFLTGSADAWVWLIEIAAWATVIRGLGGDDGPSRAGIAPFALLFALSSLSALPVDLAEALFDLGGASGRELLEGLGDNTSGIFWVRAILDAAAGAGLAVVASRGHWSRERVLRFGSAIAIAWLGWTLLALPFFFARQQPFQPLFAVTLGPTRIHSLPAFAGLASNVDPYPKLAALLLPWLVFVLAERTAPRWARLTALAGLALGIPALAATYLRHAWAFVVVLAVGSLWALRETGALDLSKGSPARTFLRRVAIGGCAAAGGLIVLTPLGTNILKRISDIRPTEDWVRGHLLAVAGRMFLDFPFQGGGTGRFAALYPHYSRWPDLAFGTWNSHNLLAQLLSEQGLVGLGCFGLLVWAALWPGLRRRRSVTASQPAFPFLLVGLAAFSVMSLSSYTLQVRAVALVFWIELGLVAAIAATVVPDGVFRLSRRPFVAASIVLVLAGTLRAGRALTRPLEPGYESGFHGWEQGLVRWTRGRSIRFVRVEGRTLLLPLANPAVSRLGHQRVWVKLDGRLAAEAWIENGEWRTLELPVDRRLGSTLAVEILCSPAFHPAELGLRDARQNLGVRTRPISWR